MISDTKPLAGAPVVENFADVTLTVASIHGKTFRFATSVRRDPIQRAHRDGEFYEATELELIKSVFPLGGVFVDIGANVGNHSLFVAGFLSPSLVVPFEPNTEANRLLRANVALNDFHRVFDLSQLGVGLSDMDAEGFAMQERTRNLGAAKMLEGQGDIPVRRGDDMLRDLSPDFIKIDVEGMELGVLRGLTETLNRARPWMLVEVDDENASDFHDWTEQHGYQVEHRVRRYKMNENFLLKPAEN